MRRDGKLQDAETDGRTWPNYRRGTQEPVTGERRKDEPATIGMVDGVRTAIHEADTDSDSLRLQGSGVEPFMDCSRREREREGQVSGTASRAAGVHSPWSNWPDEPGVDRVVDGVPNRMDRIRCLGNAVVPQQFYIFFKLIADIEK